MDSITLNLINKMINGYKIKNKKDDGTEEEIVISPRTIEEINNLSSRELKELYSYSLTATSAFLGKRYKQIEKDPDISKENKDKLLKELKNINNYLKLKEKDILDYHKFNFLPQFNIEITENDIDNKGDTIEENISTREFDDAKHIKISVEGNSTALVKLLLGTLPQLDREGDIILSEYGLPQLAEFGKTFNFVANTLAGERNLKNMIAKLKKYSEIRPELKALIRRLDFDSSDPKSNFRIKTEFQQTFAKTKLNYFMWMLGSDGKIYPFESTSDSQTSRIIENWLVNIKNTLGKENSIIKRDKDGSIVFAKTRLDDKVKEINKLKTSTERSVAKLKLFGIDILNTDDFDAQDLLDHSDYMIKVALDNVTVDELFKKQSARIKKLADGVSANYNDVELQHIGPDGETRYSITLNNLLSIISDTIDKLPVENARNILFEEFPHLDNVYTQNSIWLKLDGILFDENGNRKVSRIVNGVKQYAKFKLSVIEGAKQEDDSSSGETTADMKFPDKLWMSFNSIMMGTHPFLRAADKSLEFAFETENLTSPSTLGLDRPKILNTFKGYIYDEIKRAQLLNSEGIGHNIQYYNSPDGIANGKTLFIFEKLNIPGLTEILVKGDINEFLKVNEEKINDYIVSEWIDKLKKEFTNKLLENSVIIKTEGGFINNGISNDVLSMDSNYEKSKESIITFDVWNNIIESFVVNSVTANIEQTKLFTGDPAVFKSIGDFYKRTGGPVGTKKLCFTDNYINDFLNKFYKRSDLKGSNNTTNKASFNVIASSDVNVESRYLKEYEEAILATGMSPDKVKLMMSKTYEGYDEADGQGFITMDEYRELLVRAASWTKEHDKAYNTLIKAKKGDIIDPKLLAYFQPLKAQYFGPKYTERRDPNNVNSTTFLKFSLLPLLPSVIEGTSLEQLNASLEFNKIGIHVFGSGEKIGALLDNNGNLRPFYSKDGSINTDISEETIQKLDYRFMGIQVDIAPKVKPTGIFGTQFRKLLLSNFYENGKAKAKRFVKKVDGIVTGLTEIRNGSQEAENKAKRYEQIVSKITKQRWDNLLKRLNAEKNGDYYEFKDVSNLVNILVAEGISRQVPDNLIESIQTITDEELKTVKLKYPLDALPTRNKIENILMALVNSSVIKQKVKGGGRIQGSITGFENSENFREFSKEKGKFKSSKELLYYRKGAFGETLPAQLKIGAPKDLLPYIEQLGGLNEFNKKLRRLYSEVRNSDGSINKALTPRYNKKLQDEIGIDPRLFSIIGYRIPTQGLNSIDNFEIVEFLDIRSAELVLVPSEIVAKSGSDFDIDKLNVFLPHYKVELEKFNLEEIKDFKNSTYFYNIEPDVREWINKLSEEDFNSLIKELNDLSITGNVSNKGLTLQEYLISLGKADSYEPLLNIKENLIQYNRYKKNTIKSNEQLKNLSNLKLTYIDFNENSEESLMNELIQLSSDIITSPENLAELITPNTDYDIKKIAEEIKKEKQKGAGINKSKIVLWDYIQDIGKYFLVGKAGVGQLALHITHHSLAQKIGLKLPEEKYFKLNFKDMENEYSMSREYDINGKKGNKISDILSQFLNGFVDVAKEPFVFFLNASTSTNDTIAYLLRRGVPLNTVGYFMTQPIIDEYLHAQSVWESEMMKSKSTADGVKPKSSDEIVQELIKKHVDKFKEVNNNLNNKAKAPIARILNEQRLKDYVKSPSQIEKISDTDPLFHEVQIQVLKDFIKYQEEAKIVAKLMKVTKPDTTTPKNISSTKLKELTINTVLDSKMFDMNTINKFNKETLLNEFNTVQNNISSLYNELFITESTIVQNELEKILSVYNNTSKSDADILQVLDLFKNDFITYLLHTSPVINKKDIMIALNQTYVTLLSKENEFNVAKLLKKAQRSKKLKDNLIIKEMQAIIEDNKRKFDHVKLFNKRMSTYSSNMLTESFRELIEAGEPIAELLRNTAIVQGNLQNSYISYLEKIPYEFYALISERAINNFLQKPFGITNFVDQFYRNNYMNNNLVPKLSQSEHNKIEKDVYIASPMSNAIKYPYIKIFKFFTKDKKAQEALKLAGKPIGEFILFRADGPRIEGKPRRYERVSKLGDSFYFKEYYRRNKSSIIKENNFDKSNYENLPNDYFDKLEFAEDNFDNLVEFSSTEKEDVLKAFATKHKLTEEQALESINKMITKNKENAIKFLNKCK
jgi:hypothetical protein